MNKRSELSQERIKFFFFSLMHNYEKQVNLWVFEEFTMTVVQLKNKQLLLQVKRLEMPTFILLALKIAKYAVPALNSYADVAHPWQPGRAEVAGLNCFSSVGTEELLHSAIYFFNLVCCQI